MKGGYLLLLSFRRTELGLPAIALAGAVVALDLLWSLLVGPTDTPAYGLIDLPAHLAACAVVLWALIAVAGSRVTPRFALAALVASVAIDVDHVPGYLGWDVLTGAHSRPYSHSLTLVFALVVFGCLARDHARETSLGLAFGVAVHLLRDLVSGGVPVVWPLSTAGITLPYAVFAGSLVIAVTVIALRQRTSLVARLGVAIALAAICLCTLAIPVRVARAADGPPISIGAFISGADNNPALINDFANEVGRPVATALIYKDWSQAPFVYSQLDGVWNHGAAPLITWEPWGVSLKRIAKGRYDGYIRDAARAAAGWGKPLFVRFAQEMNGDWFPWGGHPTAFKRAWRHIVGIFRKEGADQVRWIWNPYVNSRGGRLPFTPYYPGGKWVDWAGLDAVNWGGRFPWRTFMQIIGRSYHQMVKLTDKPIILAEVGSGEQGGDKPHWLAAMLRHDIPHMGHVRALSFWSADDPRGDLRVDSSPSALEAIRSALAKPLYRASRSTLLSTPLRLGR